MNDPKESFENLRRSQFRVDILGWLIDAASASDQPRRVALDKKIWEVMAGNGLNSSTTADNEVRIRFCETGSTYTEYSALIEAKLMEIPE